MRFYFIFLDTGRFLICRFTFSLTSLSKFSFETLAKRKQVVFDLAVGA